MSVKDTPAVPNGNGPNPATLKEKQPVAVQKKRGPHTGKSLGLSRFSKEDLDKKFWSRVQRGAGCWLWIGAKSDMGYGAVRLGKLVAKASRVSYEIAHGPIPPGLVVRHTCDTPACVNPAHLVTGTQADNIRDRWNKQDDGLISIEEAAEYCGLDVKRLRGRIFRNSVRLGDPIGNATHVYRWSLPRPADATSGAP